MRYRASRSQNAPRGCRSAITMRTFAPPTSTPARAATPAFRRVRRALPGARDIGDHHRGRRPDRHAARGTSGRCTRVIRTRPAARGVATLSRPIATSVVRRVLGFPLLRQIDATCFRCDHLTTPGRPAMNPREHVWYLGRVIDFVARLGVLRAVVERGSISAAAAGLGVSVSTASWARSSAISGSSSSRGPRADEADRFTLRDFAATGRRSPGAPPLARAAARESRRRSPGAAAARRAAARQGRRTLARAAACQDRQPCAVTRPPLDTECVVTSVERRRGERSWPPRRSLPKADSGTIAPSCVPGLKVDRRSAYHSSGLIIPPFSAPQALFKRSMRRHIRYTLRYHYHLRIVRRTLGHRDLLATCPAQQSTIVLDPRTPLLRSVVSAITQQARASEHRHGLEVVVGGAVHAGEPRVAGDRVEAGTRGRSVDSAPDRRSRLARSSKQRLACARRCAIEVPRATARNRGGAVSRATTTT